MHSLKFHPDFFFPIKYETKRQGIFPISHPPIKLGDELSLFTDGENPKLIRTATVSQVSPIYLSRKKETFTIIMGLKKLPPARIDLLALAEGYKNTENFIADCVLQHLQQPEFFGNLIKWNCTPCEENNSGIEL